MVLCLHSCFWLCFLKIKTKTKTGEIIASNPGTYIITGSTGKPGMSTSLNRTELIEEIYYSF